MNRGPKLKSNGGWSRRAILGAALGAPFAFGARADTYPTHPVRLIVPFPAGGTTDILARIVADQVGQRLGQPVIVESRPGAGGNVAGEYIARNEADGYNILVAGQSILAINKPMYKKMPYDPVVDFTFIGMLGAIANVLLVNPKVVPANSIAELIALAKKQPGGISYGSNGPGSLSHLTVEVMAHDAGVKFLHVPYRGAAPLMADLLGGQVGMCFTGESVARPLISSGQLRALAVSTAKRSRYSPELPTLIESGFLKLDAPTWFGAVVRSATPTPVLDRIRKELTAVIASESYSQALQKQAIETMIIPEDKTEEFLVKERKLWGEAVKTTGVTVE